MLNAEFSNGKAKVKLNKRQHDALGIGLELIKELSAVDAMNEQSTCELYRECESMVARVVVPAKSTETVKAPDAKPASK